MNHPTLKAKCHRPHLVGQIHAESILLIASVAIVGAFSLSMLGTSAQRAIANAAETNNAALTSRMSAAGASALQKAGRAAKLIGRGADEGPGAGETGLYVELGDFANDTTNVIEVDEQGAVRTAKVDGKLYYDDLPLSLQPSPNMTRRHVQDAIKIARSKSPHKPLVPEELFAHVKPNTADEALARVATAMISDVRQGIGERAFQTLSTRDGSPHWMSPSRAALVAITKIIGEPQDANTILRLIRKSWRYGHDELLDRVYGLHPAQPLGVPLETKYRFETVWRMFTEGIDALERDKVFGRSKSALSRSSHKGFDARAELARTAQQLDALSLEDKQHAIQNGLLHAFRAGERLGLPTSYVSAVNSLPLIHSQTRADRLLALEAMTRSAARGNTLAVQEMSAALKGTLTKHDTYFSKSLVEQTIDMFETFANRFAAGDVMM